MKRYLSLLFSVILVLSLFTACGSSSYDGSASGEVSMNEMAPEEAAPDRLSNSSAPGETKLPDNRKWVITSEVRAETNDLDATLEAVLAKAAELQGYVEDQHFDSGSYYGGYDEQRSARMTVRIPAESIDQFMETMEEQTNVISSSKNLQDITLQYSDTETRIKALEKEEARLLEFMEQAETMADLLEIERRLTEVHYELENVNSRLRTYDNQVNFATIHLTLEEVKVYTPLEEPSVPERISTGFMNSVRGVWKGCVDFFVEFIVSLPYLAVWAVVVTVIVLIVKACTKKNQKKKQKKAPGKEAPKPETVPEEWKKFDQIPKEQKEEKK